MVQSEWFGPLVRYLEQARTALGTYVPNLLGATVLLLVGWLVARILRALANRLIPRIYRILPARAQRELRDSTMDTFTVRFAAGVLYWLVLVLFFAAATDSLTAFNRPAF